VGEDEHSVGLREILDIKHGGIERYGFQCHYLGTSVGLERLLDVTTQTGSQAILISTIITHGNVHVLNMRNLGKLAEERGLRERLVLIAGGTQVNHELARECGLDAGFGRGATGRDVASMIVRTLQSRQTTNDD
jgi:D-ornithine 4,5-aminomutase subunit beta